MSIETNPSISAVVSTKGRDADMIARMIQSLVGQGHQHLEIVIIDQNADARARVLESLAVPFPIKYVHGPEQAGLSKGRNSGIAVASGSILFFPDDDCWYPENFLRKALDLMTATGADIVTGRAADETGRTINGRSETSACRIDRANVWTTGIEWVTFFKASVFDRLGGYDENIGVGSVSPWQSCEGQDIILRALGAGFTGHYDPALFGHHAEIDIYDPDPATCLKGRKYGRGLGHVLRIHGYGRQDAAKWIARPCARAAQALVMGKLKRFDYARNVALGRYEGWTGRLL